MKLKDILLFREMIGPKLITFNYWVLLFMTVSMHAFTIYAVSDSWYLILSQLVMLTISMLVIRLVCEIGVAFFRIQADLKRIADSTTASMHSRKQS